MDFPKVGSKIHEYGADATFQSLLFAQLLISKSNIFHTLALFSKKMVLLHSFALTNSPKIDMVIAHL